MPRGVAAAMAAALLTGLLTYGVTASRVTGSVIGSAPNSTGGPRLLVTRAPDSPTEAGRAPRTDRAHRDVPATTSRPAATSRPATTSRPAAIMVQAVPPRRLVIPSAGVDLPVDPMGVRPDGQMDLPGSPWRAGWYRFGAGPGAPGATVIAGHVDTVADGIGPLAALTGLRLGAELRVSTADSTYRYRVTAVRTIDKRELDLPALFERSGRPRLHVISCGGTFTPGAGYTSNVVVVAEPWP